MAEADRYLRFLTYNSLEQLALGDEYKERLEYELEVLEELDFSSYILVVSDIVRIARSHSIPVGPGRGSAGGSLALYLLGTTRLDPIAHGLIFERFVNRKRPGLPDVDIDLSQKRRSELIGLVADAYGYDRVAQVMTLGTIGAKAALKDANRVLGRSYKDGERLTKLLPLSVRGREPDLSDIRRSGLQEGDQAVLELAQGLEGLIRQAGVHAAAVIISPVPLDEILPVWKRPSESVLVTGYTAEPVEKLGLVKTDLLGLRNLDVIDQCVSYLQRRELSAMGGNADPDTYATLSRGDTIGCFQVDGKGMRQLLRAVQPQSLGDVAAVLALFRPGPMDNNYHIEFAKRRSGKSRTEYPHPELKDALSPVLGSTFGLIVFQEQLLDCLKAVGGYDYGSAALIFDAMRKKNVEKMNAARPELHRRMTERGFSEYAITALWETLVPFADYSFNKSHATGYATIAYQTAYLKTHHPVEYMSALLSSVTGDPDKLQEYLDETQRMGIPLLPPDINTSGEGFSPDGAQIRYGLSAIRGVGEKAYAAILKRRPYRGIDDLLRRADKTVLNSGVLTALVKSGSLDGLHSDRGNLVADLPRLLEQALIEREKTSTGDTGLYRTTLTVKPGGSVDSTTLREWENETLGIEMSYDTLTITVQRAMDESEWVYLRNVLAAHPGGSPVVVRFGTWRKSLSSGITIPEVRRALDPLGNVIRMD